MSENQLQLHQTLWEIAKCLNKIEKILNVDIKKSC